MIPPAAAQRNKTLGLGYGGFLLQDEKLGGEAASLGHVCTTLRMCTLTAAWLQCCVCSGSSVPVYFGKLRENQHVDFQVGSDGHT